MIVTEETFGPEWQLRAVIARARASETLADDVVRVLRAAHKDIAESIAKLGVENPTRARYTALLGSVDELLAEAYAEAHDVATAGLLKIDAAERAALAGISITPESGVVTALGTRVGRSRIVQIAAIPQTFDDVALRGINFGQWWSEGAKAAVERVKDQVQVGLVRGLNPVEIARRIFKEKNKHTGQAGGEAFKGNVKSARMVLRTVATAVQARASLDSMRASGITVVRFEAVLDARTSVICAALDGSEYDIDDPQLPIPPKHPQCRSILVPVIVWQAGPNAGKPVMKRTTSFDAWLRGESVTAQNKILGRTRAEAWRKGLISLSDLIARDSRPLNLSELEEHLRPR